MYKYVHTCRVQHMHKYPQYVFISYKYVLKMNTHYYGQNMYKIQQLENTNNMYWLGSVFGQYLYVLYVYTY